MTRLAVCAAVLALLTVPAAAQPFHHPYGEWREYNRDWLAACPDEINEQLDSFQGVSCFASTNSAEKNAANLPAWQLTLIHNRLTGALDLAFTAAPDTVELDIARPLVFEFAGAPRVSFNFTADLQTRHNVSNQWFIADPARRDALIAEMQSRNAVTLAVPLTAPGEAVRMVPLSLRGVEASLDFMATNARRVAEY